VSVPDARNGHPRPERTSEEPEGATVSLAHPPSWFDLATPRQVLAIQRSLAPLADGTVPRIGRHFASAARPLFSGAAHHPGLPEQIGPTADQPGLMSRLAALADASPAPFVFARIRRRAVAPPPPVPTRPAPAAPAPDPMDPTLARSLAIAADASAPLPAEQRRAFEPLVGGQLPEVRIHTGRSATETAAALNAEAFTVGRDIFFRHAQFAPTTLRGQALLAHELVHVHQAAEAGEEPRPAPSSNRDRAAAEAEAEAAERFVLASNQPGNTANLSVSRYVRNYSTSSGKPVNGDHQQRLDRLSLRALEVCEQLLGPRRSRDAAQDIKDLTIDLSLDLSSLSDDQAAAVWGRTLADAIRQRLGRRR